MPYDPTVTPYQLSAFGVLRVGTPFLQADIVNKYQIDPNYWGTAITGTGVVAHVPLLSAVSVKAGVTSGSALLRTHEHYRYQAGKGLRWVMTGFSSDAGNAANVRQWGVFDDDDGLFFQHARSDARNKLDIVVRSSSGFGGQTIQQQDWNRYSYPSLDPTKGNIYECSFQWLGVGTVAFYVNGFLVHTIEHANTHAGPYMRTAQLPFSVKVVDAGGTAGTSGWTSICSTLSIEGGSDPALYGYSYVKPSAPFALSTTETPLISMRPANTINSVANRSLIIPTHSTIAANAFSGGADQCIFKFYLNSTLTTGLAWTAVGGGSTAERDIGTTAAGFVAGTLIDTALISTGGAASIDKDLSNLFNLHARKLMRRDNATITLDLLTVTAQLNAGTGTGACDICWLESA